MISCSQLVYGIEKSSRDYRTLLLIGGMAYLNYQDEILMVSTPVCMVTHWTKSTMNHDISLLVVMIH